MSDGTSIVRLRARLRRGARTVHCPPTRGSIAPFQGREPAIRRPNIHEMRPLARPVTRGPRGSAHPAPRYGSCRAFSSRILLASMYVTRKVRSISGASRAAGSPAPSLMAASGCKPDELGRRQPAILGKGLDALPDHRQALAKRQRARGETVPAVVRPDIPQFRPLAHGAGLLPCDHPEIVPFRGIPSSTASTAEVSGTLRGPVFVSLSLNSRTARSTSPHRPACVSADSGGTGVGHRTLCLLLVFPTGLEPATTLSDQGALPVCAPLPSPCLGSEINWTRPRPISVSAESSTGGLDHALTTALHTSDAGEAAGKGREISAANRSMRTVRGAHTATSADPVAEGKWASSMIAFNFSRAALAQPCHFGRPTGW